MPETHTRVQKHLGTWIETVKGYEVRKNYPLADYVCYLPLDTKVNAQRFVKLIKPVFTFFVKYDFWPNYLIALQNLNHKHYVISAIFRNNHYFFKKTGAWMLNVISNFDHLFVQIFLSSLPSNLP